VRKLADLVVRFNQASHRHHFLKFQLVRQMPGKSTRQNGVVDARAIGEGSGGKRPHLRFF
jgi:hypothetical protein